MRDTIEAIIIGGLVTCTPLFEDLNILQHITGTFAIATIVLALFMYLEDKKRA